LNKLTGRTASTLYLGALGTNEYGSPRLLTAGRHGNYRVGLSYTVSKSFRDTFGILRTAMLYRINWRDNAEATS
jgi:hypothetical protein